MEPARRAAGSVSAPPRGGAVVLGWRAPMHDLPPPAIVLDVFGRRIVATDALDAAHTLLTTAFGFDGDRSRIGPFAAWQAERLGGSVDPDLPDAPAAAALLAVLLASGAAVEPPAAPVLPLRP